MAAEGLLGARMGGAKSFLLIASYARSVKIFRGDLILALAASGYKVHVAVPSDEADENYLENLPAEIHTLALNRVGMNPLGDIWYMCCVFFLALRIRPDVVLGYTAKPVIYGTLAAWLAGVPRRFALITGLGYAFARRNNFLTKLIIYLYRTSLSVVHGVIFQNPDDRELFRRIGLIRSSSFVSIVNGSGVNVSDYFFNPIPSGPVVFLMIGRLLGDKGVREYIEAARRIKAMRPDAVFQLAGWIDINPDAVSQQELDGWVDEGFLDFLGKLDDVRPAIVNSTVYVLPSYREGTPRTVLEAMAMGRPIITTDAPGCRETVIDGDNGFLVPVQSVDSLVDAMLKFIEDSTLASRMGKRSREIAEEKYDVHKVNAVMLREMGITPAQEEAAHGA